MDDIALSVTPVDTTPVGKTRRSAVDLVRRWWGAGIVLAAFVCLLVTGLQGIDFGYHWDEPAQLRLVNQTIRTGSFIPGRYNYPAITYLLSVGSALPQVLTNLNSAFELDGDDFFLRTRTVFLTVSALGGIWIYLALRRRAGELGAAFGGATYLLSFQLAYHARWIAPDAVMASAAALFILLLVLAWDAPESTWRTYLPTVGAALAAASKYQGGVLLVPVMIMFIVRWRAAPASWLRQVKQGLLSLLLFAAIWLIINPGVITQHDAFRRDFDAINWQYRTGHISFHGAAPSYEVSDPARYLWRLAQYVGLSLPSHWLVLSVAVVIVAIAGVVTLVWRERWLGVALVAPCVVLAIYFSTLHVFIARNFLLLLPFVAFFAGLGVGRVKELARGRIAASVVTVVAVGVMALNAVWLVHAASTVSQGLPETLEQTASYMRDRPDDDFVVSTALARRLRDLGEPLPANAHVGGQGDEVLVLLSEIRDNPRARVRRWPSTQRGSFRTIGPLEVDFDFYSTWAGDDRVLIFTPDQLRQRGIEVN